MHQWILANLKKDQTRTLLLNLRASYWEVQSSPPKLTCTTSNVALSEAFHNLECLLRNSLEPILCDVETTTTITCIFGKHKKQPTHEKVCGSCPKNDILY
jgi:hypothetical protein